MRNLSWSADGAQYESDLVVKIDSYLLLVEATSGTISLPALRGAPDRAKRHIEELLLEPSIQSKRLADKLLAILNGNEKDDELRQQLPFDLRRIQKIIRLSVTLEDFATIQSNVASLKGTGWVPDSFVAAPTMLMADLEIVFDMLGSIPERIHYLIRREELEEQVRYTGDELDLLGLYLASGFNLGEQELGQYPWMLFGMSKEIDVYYIAQDEGIGRDKPALKSTTWWTDIRKGIEEHHPERWSEAAVMLLNVGFDDQQKLEKKFKKIRKNVKKNWRRAAHRNSIILCPPEWRSEAFALMAFRDRQKEERHDLMESIAAQVFSKCHATRCLVIGVNIDRSQYPYSVLGVFDRP